MTKKKPLRLFKNGRLRDGSMRFVVRLPRDLADAFELEMRRQERKKLPLARYIIGNYFRARGNEPQLEDLNHIPAGVRLRELINRSHEIAEQMRKIQ